MSDSTLNSQYTILIRKATEADFMIVAELGARTFYETWRPVNTEKDMQTYIAKAFDPQLIRKDLANDVTNTFYIAYSDNKPVGYAKLRRDRTYDEFKESKPIELERIYVEKQFQDMHVGRALMDQCIKLANEEKYDWLWLGVNIDNAKAIAFYKKYGFTIFGEKSFQLGDADDNDYLMKLRLSYLNS